MRVLAESFLLTALLGGSAFAGEWTRTYAVPGQPEILVVTDDASVTVRPWSENRIAARVTTSGWKIGPGEVVITDSQTGNRVEITVRVPHEMFHIFSGNRWIRVELQVPSRIAADIRTKDGAIVIDGVEGSTRLRTGDGRIEAESMKGSLEAETGDGHIKVSGRLDVLRLHTGDGAVEADLLPGSKLTAPCRVDTGDGSVVVRLPRDLGAELDARTGDGKITVDLPITAETGNRREGSVRARINGGGPVLWIRTGDGSIRLSAL